MPVQNRQHCYSYQARKSNMHPKLLRNIFGATVWFPSQRPKLWCFLWSAPVHAVEQTIEAPVILDRHRAHHDVTVMTSLMLPVNNGLCSLPCYGMLVYNMILFIAWQLQRLNVAHILNPHPMYDHQGRALETIMWVMRRELTVFFGTSL